MSSEQFFPVAAEFGDARVPLTTNVESTSIDSILHISGSSRELCKAVVGSLTNAKGTNKNEAEAEVYKAVLRFLPYWIQKSKHNAPASAVWKTLSTLIDFDDKKFAVDIDEDTHSPNIVLCKSCGGHEVALIRLNGRTGQFCQRRDGSVYAFCHRCIRAGRRCEVNHPHKGLIHKGMAFRPHADAKKGKTSATSPHRKRLDHMPPDSVRVLRIHH